MSLRDALEACLFPIEVGHLEMASHPLKSPPPSGTNPDFWHLELQELRQAPAASYSSGYGVSCPAEVPAPEYFSFPGSLPELSTFPWPVAPRHPHHCGLSSFFFFSVPPHLASPIGKAGRDLWPKSRPKLRKQPSVPGTRGEAQPDRHER